jgi:hypothetical protein
MKEFMTVTHVKVKSLIRRVKGTGHKRYLDSFFSCPDLVDDVHNSCQLPQTWQNHKKILGDIDMLKLKWDDI